jgi:U3 small nucleolar RNA-associated protein 18
MNILTILLFRQLIDPPPSLENATFSPSGDLVAISARRGTVHLVDWRSGGAGGVGQVVSTIKANSPVKSMWWSGGATASDSHELMTLGADCQVYVWDIRAGGGENKCVRRWMDDGAFGSSILAGDRAGKYLAVGYVSHSFVLIAAFSYLGWPSLSEYRSTTGLVNVYGSDAATSLSAMSGANPKPLKTIQNLTTKISTIRFNHDSQLLALASSDKNDAMRLVTRACLLFLL